MEDGGEWRTEYGDDGGGGWRRLEDRGWRMEDGVVVDGGCLEREIFPYLFGNQPRKLRRNTRSP